MTERADILILYNIPASSGNSYVESEAGVLEEVKAVSTALSRLGIPHRDIGLRTLEDLPAFLARTPARIAVNLVEGFSVDSSDVNYVPAICRGFGIEVTGTDTPALCLTLDKWKTKLVLTGADLRCPVGVIVPVGAAIPFERLRKGSYIIKPVATDASEGIDEHSVVDAGSAAMEERVRQIHTQFGQPALIEEMVGERELNVSVFQRGDNIEVLPLAEIDFSAFTPGKPRIVGYTAKWKNDTFEYRNTNRIIPAPLTPKQADAARKAATAAWHAVGCRDYARVDMRLDNTGRPVILEVNCNPDISPDAGFAAALSAAGIPYEDFIRTLILNAEKRLESDKAPVHKRVDAYGRNMPVRRCAPTDRTAILEMLNQPDFFRPDEIEIAREVLDEALKHGENGHYQSFVAESGGHLLGWICFGPTPCTLGTYDIYWIAVAKDQQRRQVGNVLMHLAEERIRAAGGRLAVAETSGRHHYVPTRQFYARLGYVLSSRIADFYAPGDDKVLYTKSLR